MVPDTRPMHLDLIPGEPEELPEQGKGGVRIQLGLEGGAKRLQVTWEICHRCSC